MRWQVIIASLMLAAGLGTGLDDSRAQPRPAAEPAGDLRGVYVGISGCANGACHGATEPRDGPILGNEYHTRVLDPHYRAYDLLGSELSAQIAGALEPGSDARHLDLCLDCHTVHVPPARNQGLYVDDGISCEGCHGPAGGWVNRHFEDGWSHQQSVREGMNDLRDPAARARVCLRCHLGSGDRTVDHRLIAAGHPILRFELDNYTEEPSLRHWRVDDAGRRWGHGIAAWAVGQVAAFRTGLLLLTDQAAGDGPWPEFAQLSCANCHHALDGTWREQAGYRFRGGLPQWSPARWTVLRHLTAAVAPRELERLDQEVAVLARRVAAMSDRHEVARLARAVAESLEPVVSGLGGARWSRRRVSELISSIAQNPDPTLDLASAEQIALSLHSLVSHLTHRNPRLAGSPLVDAVDGLFAELEAPGDFDRASFADRLQQLLGSLPVLR